MPEDCPISTCSADTSGLIQPRHPDIMVEVAQLELSEAVNRGVEFGQSSGRSPATSKYQK
jgi:hypothetical protein